MRTNFDDLPEIPPSRGGDLHNLEYMANADLVLFMAGNQFMVMDDLLREFQGLHPDVQRIFYETLPPGLELQQIIAGRARFGTMVIDVRPDIYTAVSDDAMMELTRRRLIDNSFVYLHNRIVLMVRKGNPRNILAVHDLGRDEIRISQPGPLEDISRHITAMYEKAGGVTLRNRILGEKREEGTTIFTIVHHRETPLRLGKGTADVGPVWATEVVHAINEGLDVEAVEPGGDLDQSGSVNYYAAKISNSGNPENAEKFLSFIRSSTAQKIYQSYGFVPHFSES